MKLTHNVIIIILYFKKLLTWMGFNTKLPMVKLHNMVFCPHPGKNRAA
jgi:hypothetical protein